MSAHPLTLAPFAVAGAPFVARHAARCFCERVRFEVSSEPLKSKICDCTVCMRLHGAPMQWALIFHKKAVRFTHGTDLVKFYSPSLDAEQDPATRVLPCKLSCKHCGSWIADEGRRMFLTFPSVFDTVRSARAPLQFPSSFLPQCHIHYATHALDAHDSLPKFVDDCRTPWHPNHSPLSSEVSKFLMGVAPPLDGSSHKGQGGRVGIVGGSRDYTGAPFYAGMGALRVGAELVYVFTAQEAALPLKTFSPELMVSPVYSHEWDAEKMESEVSSRVEPLLPRLHALVVGPGLGRDPNVLDAVALIISKAKAQGVPIVVDADGLFLVTQRPALVSGYAHALLTPNKIEFGRLFSAVMGRDCDPHADDRAQESEVLALCQALGHVAIVRKGKRDIVSDGRHVLVCDAEGAPRRCGGIGDILSGTAGVLAGWAAGKDSALVQQAGLQQSEASVQLWAALSACVLVRQLARKAFAEHKRAMTVPDMLGHIGGVFEALCPSKC